MLCDDYHQAKGLSVLYPAQAEAQAWAPEQVCRAGRNPEQPCKEVQRLWQREGTPTSRNTEMRHKVLGQVMMTSCHQWPHDAGGNRWKSGGAQKAVWLSVHLAWFGSDRGLRVPPCICLYC